MLALTSSLLSLSQAFVCCLLLFCASFSPRVFWFGCALPSCVSVCVRFVFPLHLLLKVFTSAYYVCVKGRNTKKQQMRIEREKLQTAATQIERNTKKRRLKLDTKTLRYTGRHRERHTHTNNDRNTGTNSSRLSRPCASVSLSSTAVLVLSPERGRT